MESDEEEAVKDIALVTCGFFDTNDENKMNTFKLAGKELLKHPIRTFLIGILSFVPFLITLAFGAAVGL